MTGPILQLEGISKAFAGIHALRNVSLSLDAGRILGLVGENGAGKSTLMNVVGGVIRPDSGGMLVDRSPYRPASPRAAADAGIAFIHQELNLFTNLTIAENIFLTRFPRRKFGPWALIDRAEVSHRTRELLDEVHLDLAPDTPLDRLSPGERQLVEIARALQLDAMIIIFDEPTTSLTPRETDRLFALVGRLREAGKAIIYISHILADVLVLSDEIAVLRDGERVAFGDRADFDVGNMVNLMVGRSIDRLYPPKSATPRSDIVLSTRGLSATGIIKDINVVLHQGEVVGMFGLLGSGRTELARIMFGLEPHESGEIAIGERVIAAPSPGASIRAGVAFVTENRREEGLMMSGSIAENIAMAALPKFSLPIFGLIERTRLREVSLQYAEALRLKSSSLDPPVRSLSGGNQQKVVLAKWLMCEPSALIMDEPTRGIDVGAKYEIYAIIDRLAAGGTGIFLISSDLEELLAISDRILVMNKGEIVGAFPRADFNRQRILASAFGEPGVAV